MAKDSIEHGTLSFSVEARLLRELGERLVRRPEIALVELIKNAYDADATGCDVSVLKGAFNVVDDGLGMTLDQFVGGWMRIGTSAEGRHSRINAIRANDHWRKGHRQILGPLPR